MLIKRILSYFPSKLPTGLTEFHSWAQDIIDLSGKFADEDSMKFALASMIQHSGAAKGSMSKNYFVNCLRKSAANQVAGQVFMDIKQKQAEALAKQQAEATALQESEASDVAVS